MKTKIWNKKFKTFFRAICILVIVEKNLYSIQQNKAKRSLEKSNERK